MMSLSPFMRSSPCWLLALVVAVASVGCASTPSETPDVSAPVPTQEPVFDPGPPAQETSSDIDVKSPLGLSIGTVYFDVDGAIVGDNAKRVLENTAATLIETGKVIIIEGHCSQDGDEEYNLELGQRRAESIRDILHGMGVPLRQMHVVSYGESMPAVEGEGEMVQNLNRRAEFREL